MCNLVNIPVFGILCESPKVGASVSIELSSQCCLHVSMGDPDTDATIKKVRVYSWNVQQNFIPQKLKCEDEKLMNLMAPFKLTPCLA